MGSSWKLAVQVREPQSMRPTWLGWLKAVLFKQQQQHQQSRVWLCQCFNCCGQHGAIPTMRRERGVIYVNI